MIIMLSFFSVALVFTLLVTWHFYSQGEAFLASVLAGSCVGVLVAYFICQIIYLVTMRITRGALFHIGDKVEITNGPHKGKIGKVENICEGRLCVGVILELETGITTKEIFDWDEIRKLQLKLPT